jgi:hypothetical protein
MRVCRRLSFVVVSSATGFSVFLWCLCRRCCRRTSVFGGPVCAAFSAPFPSRGPLHLLLFVLRALRWDGGFMVLFRCGLCGRFFCASVRCVAVCGGGCLCFHRCTRVGGGVPRASFGVPLLHGVPCLRCHHRASVHGGVVGDAVGVSFPVGALAAMLAACPSPLSQCGGLSPFILSLPWGLWAARPGGVPPSA